MKVIVIGGVAAGTKAAAKLKREDRSAEVKILTKSEDISYAGCGLPYYVSGVIGSRDVELINPAAAIERRVESLLELHGLQAAADHRPEYTFLTAADEAYRQRLMIKGEQACQMSFE